MTSKNSRTQYLLYVLLAAVAVMVGVAAGFAIAYVIRECDDDDDDTSSEPDDTGEPWFLFNHEPGPCKEVPGIDIGSEDMVMIPSGLVIITAGLTAFMPQDRSDLRSRKGSLMLFDFNDPGSGAHILEIENEEDFTRYADFNPHGMSVYTDPVTDRHYVFVVNHNDDTADPEDIIESMEKFEFHEDTRMLTYIGSIQDDNIILMNNVFATSPDTFYYTNFMSSSDPEIRDRELQDGTPAGSIAYYDGERGHILITALSSPNGINISPDGRYLYVSIFGAEHLATYKIEEGGFNLTPHGYYDMHTAPDNIDIEGGYVWIGCHINHDRLLEYLAEPTIPAPSQALRLKIEEGNVTEIIEFYADDGNKFSAITVVLHHEGKLLMGSVYTKAYYCEAEYIG